MPRLLMIRALTVAAASVLRINRSSIQGKITAHYSLHGRRRLFSGIRLSQFPRSRDVRHFKHVNCISASVRHIGGLMRRTFPKNRPAGW